MTEELKHTIEELTKRLDKWLSLQNPFVGSVKLHYNKKTGESNYSIELPFNTQIDDPLVKFGEAAVYIRDAMQKYDLTGGKSAPASQAKSDGVTEDELWKLAEVDPNIAIQTRDDGYDLRAVGYVTRNILDQMVSFAKSHGGKYNPTTKTWFLKKAA